MDILPLRAADSATAASSTRSNFAGLDALRAFAAMGVVLLHACVPYLRHPMPGLSWSVADTPHTAIDLLFWSIELFIMPLFLVLAGFFAWRTLKQRGPRSLFRGRARRLLVPLLFGAVVILPLDLYCWVGSWVAEGLVSPVKLKSLKVDPPLGENLWGLSHLWFLQYLFLYITCLTGLALLTRRYPWIKGFQPDLKTSLILTVVASSAVLYFEPQVVWGFQHSFLPVPAKWLYSGIFFTLGLLLAIHDPKLMQVRQWATRLSAPALMTGMAALLMGRWQLAQWASSTDPTQQASSMLAGVLLATLTAVAALLTTLFLIGISVKKISRIPNSVGYLAAASFWVYIVHHPLLGLTQLDLKLLLPDTTPLLKTTFSFAIASGVSLLTYEGLVRRSRLGQLLGFQWSPPADRGEASESNPILSIRNAESQDSESESDGQFRRAA